MFWYHGTDRQAAEQICREGFRSHSFFARNMQDALEFGGRYVFYVLFEEDPGDPGDPDDWQVVIPEPVPKDRIYKLTRHLRFTLYEDRAVLRRQWLVACRLEHGPQAELCDVCRGDGDVDNRQGGTDTCRRCGGTGCLVDGRKVLQ